MSEPLPGKLRAKWDSLIATEGKRLGLTDCRPFLENKMVNDIFYEGRFNGRPCIVKCSSKAPDSIKNEYDLSLRIFRHSPSVTPEPLAYWMSDDNRAAFVVTAKIMGYSLTELIAKGLSPNDVDRVADDILMLLRALENTNVVHRDLFTDNLFLDSDGHLKAIDFQFAIDRTNYRECEWMQKNRKYQYVVFGVNHDLGLGVWNDAAALLRITEKLPQSPKTKEVMEKLRKSFTNGLFRAPPDVMTKIKLWFYALSLVMQKFLHRKDAAKCARLETRLNRMRSIVLRHVQK
ncbi:MAG: hypothetical protein KIH06_05075 [Kiritimatiellae bacterium]|nr:hypothetical protein [Kiritimatiellia bacterium]